MDPVEVADESLQGGRQEVIKALHTVHEILQSCAEGGDEHAANLLKEWEKIAEGILTKKLARLPGILRGRVAENLDGRGFERETKLDCAVILDRILRQVAETFPGMIAKQSGTLGGVPVAAAAISERALATSNVLQTADLDLNGACGFLVTTRSQRGETQNAMKEFSVMAEKCAPWLAITGARSSNCIVFVAKGWQDRGDVLRVMCSMFNSAEGNRTSFQHCERIWPVQMYCEDTLDSVIEAVRCLATPLLGKGADPTTFAVRNEGGALRAVSIGLNAALAQIANIIPDCHNVDLRQPAVLVQVRGFVLQGTRLCGVCIAEAQELSLRKSEQQFSHASAGYSYYHEAVNSDQLGHSCSCAQPYLSLPAWDALEHLSVKIDVAMQQIDPDGVLLKTTSLPSEFGFQCQAGSRTAKARKKQLSRDTQVQALVDAIEASNLLPSVTATIEFGAGQGAFTHQVRKRISEHMDNHSDSVEEKQDSRNVVSILVDRDNTLPTWTGKRACWSENTDVHCLRIDIRNLWLPGLAKLSGHKVLGIGKHVCGAATDLALRCLCQAQADDSTNCGQAPNILGIGIALCCRHACNWDDYVGQEWMLKQGFSSEDFRLIAHLSTWAHQADERQQQLGRACKRFLDAGRVRFLNQHGFQAVVQDYVTPACTKENQLLLAVKDE